MAKKKTTKRKPAKKRSIRDESSARNACIHRRAKKGHTSKKNVRRCNSLFFAGCLTGKGTVSKTKHCQSVSRAPLSAGKARGKGRHW